VQVAVRKVLKRMLCASILFLPVQDVVRQVGKRVSCA
jgi:hypothetical protein